MLSLGNKLIRGLTLYYATWTNYSTSLSLSFLFSSKGNNNKNASLYNYGGDEDSLFLLLLPHTTCYITIKTLLRQRMFRSALNASLKKFWENTWIITRKNFWFELTCPPHHLFHLILAKSLRARVRVAGRNLLLEFLPMDLPAMRCRPWNPHGWAVRDVTRVMAHVYQAYAPGHSERTLFIISAGRTTYLPACSKGMKCTQFTSHPSISSSKSSRHLCAWKA